MSVPLNPEANPERADCEGCLSRREFLTRGAGAAAVFLALGAGAREAAALPVSFASATARAGHELRYPLPTADGATIDRENAVILARYQGHVYAFALSCPHQNTALKWLPAEGRFQCPKHKSKYRPDGAFISGRATRGIDRYPLKLEGNQVVVSLGTAFHQDKDPAGWAAATLSV